VDAHLKLQLDRNPLHHLVHTVTNRSYLLGFLATGLLSVGGFMLMPFATVFNVHNVGLPVQRLPLLFLATGLFSFVSGPLIGRACDSFGKIRVFAFGCVVTIVLVVIYTNLGPSPFWLLLIVSVVLQIGIFSRIIAASALTSALPDPADRGSYMSISSSLQQVSGGVASLVAGLVVVQQPSGVLQHFDWLGDILVGTTLVTLLLMLRVDRRVAAGGRTVALAAGAGATDGAASR
jgi:predicted MFS family arabinose efflux permease